MGKIQGDEVQVETLLIVFFLNRMRKNMSLAKRRFSEFSLFFLWDTFFVSGQS